MKKGPKNIVTAFAVVALLAACASAPPSRPAPQASPAVRSGGDSAVANFAAPASPAAGTLTTLAMSASGRQVLLMDLVARKLALLDTRSDSLQEVPVSLKQILPINLRVSNNGDVVIYGLAGDDNGALIQERRVVSWRPNESVALVERGLPNEDNGSIYLSPSGAHLVFCQLSEKSKHRLTLFAKKPGGGFERAKELDPAGAIGGMCSEHNEYFGNSYASPKGATAFSEDERRFFLFDRSTLIVRSLDAVQAAPINITLPDRRTKNGKVMSRQTIRGMTLLGDRLLLVLSRTDGGVLTYLANLSAQGTVAGERELSLEAPPRVIIPQRREVHFMPAGDGRLLLWDALRTKYKFVETRQLLQLEMDDLWLDMTPGRPCEELGAASFEGGSLHATCLNAQSRAPGSRRLPVAYEGTPPAVLAPRRLTSVQ